MKCKICRSNTSHLFNKNILSKYDISYFRCKKCFFIQTEEPYWLDEAYAESINLTDTGYMSRNLLFRNRIKYFLKVKFQRDDIFQDFGAGYGVFTRLMRDLNFDFRWSDEFTDNLFARGFESKPDIQNFAAITLFEVAEHLVDPFEQFEKLSRTTNNIIFSTELSPVSEKEISKWWYLGLEHGQHVSIWSEAAIKSMAHQLEMHCYSVGSLHFLNKKKLNPYEKAIINFSSLLHRLETRFFGSLTLSDYLKLK